jgi:hypothetical protein
MHFFDHKIPAAYIQDICYLSAPDSRADEWNLGPFKGAQRRINETNKSKLPDLLKVLGYLILLYCGLKIAAKPSKSP